MSSFFRFTNPTKSCFLTWDNIKQSFLNQSFSGIKQDLRSNSVKLTSKFSISPQIPKKAYQLWTKVVTNYAIINQPEQMNLSRMIFNNELFLGLIIFLFEIDLPQFAHENCQKQKKNRLGLKRNRLFEVGIICFPFSFLFGFLSTSVARNLSKMAWTWEFGISREFQIKAMLFLPVKTCYQDRFFQNWQFIYRMLFVPRFLAHKIEVEKVYN